MSFHHSEKEVKDQILTNTQAPVKRLICPCGCGGAVQWSRDYTALYFAFELSPLPFISVFRCSTVEELDATMNGIPPNDPCREALYDAYFEMSN